MRLRNSSRSNSQELMDTSCKSRSAECQLPYSALSSAHSFFFKGSISKNLLKASLKNKNSHKAYGILDQIIWLIKTVLKAVSLQPVQCIYIYLKTFNQMNLSFQKMSIHHYLVYLVVCFFFFPPQPQISKQFFLFLVFCRLLDC